jgi:hypothetical protein
VSAVVPASLTIINSIGETTQPPIPAKRWRRID